jgi:hypothetical protein
LKLGDRDGGAISFADRISGGHVQIAPRAGAEEHDEYAPCGQRVTRGFLVKHAADQDRKLERALAI